MFFFFFIVVDDILFFFFFQAEDGIRDYKVTGVQTCALPISLAGRVGTELFPRVDTGQFQLRVRAPAGTRLEKTEEIVLDVDHAIREEVGAQFVQITLGNVGNPPWSYPVNAIYTWNSGPQEAVLLVALEPGKRPSVDALEERLRKKLAQRWPNVRFSFEAGDIVSQVLNFGAPTPINVTVSGNNLAETRAFTQRIANELTRIPGLRDVQISQALDYPTLDVQIDRERAGQLGVTVELVAKSIVAATSSSALTTPNYWTSPTTGVPYRVAVRVPENQMSSADDLRNLPVMPDGAPRPLVSDVATVTPGATPGEIDHWNSQRTLSVTANVAGHDLAVAARQVDAAVKRAGTPPRGSTVAAHGQVEQMLLTLASLRGGLLLAIVVILLLLAANFQSIRLALVVLSTTPAVLAGVVLITFAHERRRAGDEPATAAIAAARGRLRPILMTSAAMISGMIPMALGLGEGGAQSAPLGRAVIGGLIASTVATLAVLPAMFVVGEGKGRWRSASLDPDDPQLSDHPGVTS